MLRSLPVTCLAVLLWSACTPGTDNLCQKIFEPYPDLISGRVVSRTNSMLLAGMDAYRKNDHQTAADSLAAYVHKPGASKVAHFYLANAYLALGRPYDAELHLDHLRNGNQPYYREQWEWYYVVCWVCSGQSDRALAAARKIAAGTHTYQAQAARLVKTLE